MYLGHGWDALVADARSTVSAGGAGKYGDDDTDASGKPAAGAQKPKTKASDWEEFYDQNAKAKYWFNKNTGETYMCVQMLTHGVLHFYLSIRSLRINGILCLCMYFR
jgi:hypothetical protein